MPFLLLIGMLILVFSLRNSPTTFDAILTFVDTTFGFNAAFAVGRLYEANSATRWLGGIAYDLLPAAVAGVAVLRYRRFGDRDDFNIFLITAVASGIAAICFQLIPATGPLYL